MVAELDEEKAGAVAGFGTTTRLLAGVLNLSKGEAKARAEQAGLLTPRRSLTGEVLPPALPTTATELAAGAIGPTHVRVIAATMRRIPSSTHPEAAAQAEQTLAHAARRFDPTALTRIGERLLAYLDPDGQEPVEEPETLRELRVRTGPDGVVRLNGKLDPEGGARVLEVLNSLNGRRPPIDGVPDLRSPAQRDKGCAFPSCDRPPRYCEAHHIREWLDGGATKIDNMCLLCNYHHTIVHHQGWHIRLDARDHPEFLPPKTVDPTRTPLHDPIRR